MNQRGRATGWTASAQEPPDDLQNDPKANPEADPESVARAICLRLLTARSRTRAELADALRARNVPDEVAKTVLDRFSDVGLINDADFARMFTAARHAERGLSAREIARQLRDKGVAAETVQEAVGGIDPAVEFETARRLVERKLRSMSALDEATRTRRLLGLLARKGYGPGIAYSAIRAAGAAHALEESAESL
jgi:regulatory protein